MRAHAERARAHGGGAYDERAIAGAVWIHLLLERAWRGSLRRHQRWGTQELGDLRVPPAIVPPYWLWMATITTIRVGNDYNHRRLLDAVQTFVDELALGIEDHVLAVVVLGSTSDGYLHAHALFSFPPYAPPRPYQLGGVDEPSSERRPGERALGAARVRLREICRRAEVGVASQKLVLHDEPGWMMAGAPFDHAYELYVAGHGLPEPLVGCARHRRCQRRCEMRRAVAARPRKR